MIIDTAMLIQKFSQEFNCSVDDAQAMLRTLTTIICDELREGNVIRLRGVFEIGVRNLRPYVGSVYRAGTEAPDGSTSLYCKFGKFLLDAADHKSQCQEG